MYLMYFSECIPLCHLEASKLENVPTLGMMETLKRHGDVSESSKIRKHEPFYSFLESRVGYFRYPAPVRSNGKERTRATESSVS